MHSVANQQAREMFSKDPLFLSGAFVDVLFVLLLCFCDIFSFAVVF